MSWLMRYLVIDFASKIGVGTKINSLLHGYALSRMQLDASRSNLLSPRQRTTQTSPANIPPYIFSFATSGKAVKLYMNSVFQAVGKPLAPIYNQFSNRLENQKAMVMIYWSFGNILICCEPYVFFLSFTEWKSDVLWMLFRFFCLQKVPK